jgi:SET domain-containing protein
VKRRKERRKDGWKEERQEGKNLKTNFYKSRTVKMNNAESKPERRKEIPALMHDSYLLSHYFSPFNLEEIKQNL